TECSHCHGGFAFTDSVTFTTLAFDEMPFHNTGLYNLGGDGTYPPDNHGLLGFTDVASDMGRFKAPTLRNIAVTAPYMHDGSIATLDGVLDHYAAGGRTISSGEHAGVGSRNPYKDPLVAGFTLTAERRADLVAFLEALTDEEFLTDPRLADPWPR
ncbi:MAG: di-heme enzyme, partial [Deltaproteobacteria bacterium]|nr:di-heme enzyme [Deltaproteobacteria bacterium]